MENLEQWIGRTERTVDTITATPMRALAATLDREDIAAAVAPDAALPPLWHWLYFLPHAMQHELGEDGHPRKGGFLPPVTLPRRMWAGSRLDFLAPLRIGAQAERVSTILSVEHKQGRSGELVFVCVGHEIFSDGQVAIREEHDIVYREAQAPAKSAPVAAAPSAGPDAAWQRTVVPDPVLLFRYSALTFNGHRIHYDRPYVTGVEGYPGLVVHGPLQATLLLDLVSRQRPDATVASFHFRAQRPIFDTAPFGVAGTPAADGKSVELWTVTPSGQTGMQASAVLE